MSDPLIHPNPTAQDVLKKVIDWASRRCPADDESVPCPLCGARADVPGDACKAVESIFPRELLRELRSVLAVESTPPSPHVMAVKPLEWTKRNDDGTRWSSEMTICGMFYVVFNGTDWFAFWNTWTSALLPSCDAAKAAAQSEFDRLIKSALVDGGRISCPAPAQTEVDLLRQAIVRYGDRMRMSNAPSPEMQRVIDDAFAIAVPLSPSQGEASP